MMREPPDVTRRGLQPGRKLSRCVKHDRLGKLLLVAVGVVLTLLLLGFANAILWVLGVAGHEPVMIEKSDPLGRSFYVSNPLVATNWFPYPPDSALFKRPRYERLPAEKPSKSYRIFVLGESAAVGWPQNDNGSFARMLEWMLRQRVRAKVPRVVNLGLTASTVSVYPSIVRDILPLKPDLVILLAGHNEFYGMHERPYPLRSRLGRLVRRLFVAKRIELKGPSLIENLAAQQMPPEKPPEVAAAFQDGLEGLLRAVDGVPLLLMTPLPNRLLPPFGSMNAGISGPDMDWLLKLEESGEDPVPPVADPCAGDRLGGTSPFLDEAVVSRLEELGRRFPDSALVRHLLGRAHLARHEPAKARGALDSAVDLDTLPIRATGALVAAATEFTVEREGVYPVDLAEAFFDVTPCPPPGPRCFVDHVHLSGYGNYLAGLALVRAIQDRPGLGLAVDAVAPPTYQEVRRGLAISAVDDYVIALRMLDQQARPPFDKAPGSRRRRLRLEALRDSAFRRIDELRRRALEGFPGSGVEAHSFILARLPYERYRRVSFEEAFAAVMAQPDSAPARYNYAQLLFLRGRIEEAREELAHALMLGMPLSKARDLARKVDLAVAGSRE